MIIAIASTHQTGALCLNWNSTRGFGTDMSGSVDSTLPVRACDADQSTPANQRISVPNHVLFAC